MTEARIRCPGASAGHMSEEYWSGNLDLRERERFEEHYFGCDHCFQEVERVRLIRDGLEREAGQIREQDSSVRTRRGIVPVWLGVSSGAAIAACLAVGIYFGAAHFRAADGQKPVLVAGTSNSARAAGAIPLEWRAPRYEAPEFRGATKTRNSSFVKAMRWYSQGNYGAAEQGLRETLALDRTWAPARFYLGASELLLGEDMAGSQDLRLLLKQPDSPFHAEARLLLAKSAIRTEDYTRARSLLVPLTQEPGGAQEEARKLLAAIGGR